MLEKIVGRIILVMLFFVFLLVVLTPQPGITGFSWIQNDTNQTNCTGMGFLFFEREIYGNTTDEGCCGNDPADDFWYNGTVGINATYCWSGAEESNVDLTKKSFCEANSSYVWFEREVSGNASYVAYCCGDDLTSDKFYNGTVGINETFCWNGAEESNVDLTQKSYCEANSSYVWFEGTVGGNSSYIAYCCGDDLASDDFYNGTAGPSFLSCWDGSSETNVDLTQKSFCESNSLYTWFEDTIAGNTSYVAYCCGDDGASDTWYNGTWGETDALYCSHGASVGDPDNLFYGALDGNWRNHTCGDDVCGFGGTWFFATREVINATTNWDTGLDITDAERQFYDIFLGDLDNDGYLDIVAGCYNNDVYVFPNEGGNLSVSTNWDTSEKIGDAGSFINEVALGDLDNDGYLDIVTGDGLNNVYVFPNEGGQINLTTNWDSSENVADAGDAVNGIGSIVLGDLDNDGYLDIVTGDRSNNVYVFPNEGGQINLTTNWDSSENVADAANDVNAIAIGDLNRDGYLDIVAGDASNNVYVFPNEGGQINLTTNWDSGGDVGDGGSSIDALTLGDLDNDGYLDIITGDDGADNVYVFPNEGGNISDPTNWDSSENVADAALNIGALALGDLDNDGYLDIVTTDNSANVYVFPNEGGTINDTTNWDSSENVADTGGQTWGVDLGDLDNDGDLDIVTGATSYDVYVFPNEMIKGSSGPCCGDDSTSDDFFNGTFDKDAGYCCDGSVKTDADDSACQYICSINNIWFDKSDISGNTTEQGCCGDDFISDNFYNGTHSVNSSYCCQGSLYSNADTPICKNTCNTLSSGVWFPWLNISFLTGNLDYYGNYSYSFENDTIGAAPADWTEESEANDGWVKVASSLGGHNKVLDCYSDSGFEAPSYKISRSFGDQTTGTVEFFARVTAMGTFPFISLTAILGDGSIALTSPIGVCFVDSKINTVDIGSASVTARTGVEVDTWYHIKIEFDCTADTYDLWVNGTLVGDNVAFVTNVASIDQIGFMDWASPEHHGYVDAIGFSWNDNYNVGDNKYASACCGDDATDDFYNGTAGHPDAYYCYDGRKTNNVDLTNKTWCETNTSLTWFEGTIGGNASYIAYCCGDDLTSDDFYNGTAGAAFFGCWDGSTQSNVDLTQKSWCEANSSLTWFEGDISANASYIAYCCGDDLSNDKFYNGTLAMDALYCWQGSVQTDADSTGVDLCEANNTFTWFTGTTTGSNDACCGDDQASDDFYNGTAGAGNFLACWDGSTQANVDLTQKSWCEANSSLTWFEGDISANASYIAYCCGDDLSSDKFYNGTLAMDALYCWQGSVQTELDSTGVNLCEANNTFTWFTGTTTGSNDACCGDDQASDDFYNGTAGAGNFLACWDGSTQANVDLTQRSFCEANSSLTWIDGTISRNTSYIAYCCGDDLTSDNFRNSTSACENSTYVICNATNKNVCVSLGSANTDVCDAEEWIASVSKEIHCTDTIDNDCDGYVDTGDTDCIKSYSIELNVAPTIDRISALNKTIIYRGLAVHGEMYVSDGNKYSNLRWYNFTIFSADSLSGLDAGTRVFDSEKGTIVETVGIDTLIVNQTTGYVIADENMWYRITGKAKDYSHSSAEPVNYDFYVPYFDSSDLACISIGYEWFYGAASGTSDACCGDDGELDDFKNSTSACENSIHIICNSNNKNVCVSLGNTNTDICDGTNWITTESKEVSCNDTIDNDCDGLIDINDTDCNQAPSIPELSSPADGSYTKDKTPTLQWINSTDPDNDTLGYYIEFYNSTYSEESTIQYNSETGWTVLEVSDGTYYWKVKASDKTGFLNENSSYSLPWTLIISTISPKDCIKVTPLEFYILSDKDQTISLEVKNICDLTIHNVKFEIPELNYSKTFADLVKSKSLSVIAKLSEGNYTYDLFSTYDEGKSKEILKIASAQEKVVIEKTSDLISETESRIKEIKEDIEKLLLGKDVALYANLDDLENYISNATQKLEQGEYASAQMFIEKANSMIDNIKKTVEAQKPADFLFKLALVIFLIVILSLIVLSIIKKYKKTKLKREEPKPKKEKAEPKPTEIKPKPEKIKHQKKKAKVKKKKLEPKKKEVKPIKKKAKS